MANRDLRWSPSPRAIGWLWAFGISILLWIVIGLVVSAVLAASIPPPEYDYEPTEPYEVQLVSDHRLLQLLCRYHHPLLAGCGLKDKGMIYIIDGLDPETHQSVLRHEKAHINGWLHGREG